ncbi:hypothetical protein C8Q78DRAFT_1081751 [Trametes maxima]|nr:hypothetical protein C8Q78DRAFT_1081751 [Trametes maxima]
MRSFKFILTMALLVGLAQAAPVEPGTAENACQGDDLGWFVADPALMKPGPPGIDVVRPTPETTCKTPRQHKPHDGLD